MDLSDLELISRLDKCVIEFGVLDESGAISVPMWFISSDGTKAKREMPASDAMQFAEYGTAYWPGSFALEKCEYEANRILESELPKILDEILRGGKDFAYLERKMGEIAEKIKETAKRKLAEWVKERSRLTLSLDPSSAETQRVFDFEKLINAIDCAVKFEN